MTILFLVVGFFLVLSVSYTRVLLSGSTSGRPIPVVATATAGTTMHTAVAGAASWDEIYAWFNNTDTVARTLTIEYGNAGTVGDHLVDTLSLPLSSPAIPIVTGQVLNGGLAMKAFASVASIINCTGYVNRIS
jgi:hypothetical protein